MATSVFKSPSEQLKDFERERSFQTGAVKQRQRAAKAYEQRAKQRDDYIDAVRREMDLSDREVLAQERLAQQNLEAIDQRTGQSFALAIDPYMAGGGGSTASMADIAQQAAMSKIQQRQQNENLLRQVRRNQAATQKQGIQDITQAGTRDSDYQQAYSLALADIQNAMGKFFDSDKRRAVRSAIAAAENTSPAAAATLRQQYADYA